MSRTSLAIVLLAAGVGLSPACAAKPVQKPLEGGAVDTGPGTLAAARRYLEGTWALESFEIYPVGAPPIVLKGTGRLTYDGYGNMRVEVQTDPGTGGLLRKAGVENVDGRISSDGRTVVDMQARTLAYVVEGQPTGKTEVLGPLALRKLRHWEVDGSLLTLTTKDDAGKPVSISKWRKQ
jgi:hypothetical protein